MGGDAGEDILEPGEGRGAKKSAREGRRKGPKTPLTRRALEKQPHAELQRAVFVHLHGLSAARRRHLAESGVAESGVRPVEVRRVGEVERFDPEFQVRPLADAESAENREVDFEQPRTGQNVPADIAERIRRRRRELGTIEIQLAGPVGPENLRRAADVGSIDIPRRVQACRADVHIERQAALPSPQAVHLPPTQDPLPRPGLRPALSLPEWQLVNIALGKHMPAVPVGKAAVGGEIDVVEVPTRGAGIEVDRLAEGIRGNQREAISELAIVLAAANRSSCGRCRARWCRRFGRTVCLTAGRRRPTPGPGWR